MRTWDWCARDWLVRTRDWCARDWLVRTRDWCTLEIGAQEIGAAAREIGARELGVHVRLVHTWDWWARDWCAWEIGTHMRIIGARMRLRLIGAAARIDSLDYGGAACGVVYLPSVNWPFEAMWVQRVWTARGRECKSIWAWNRLGVKACIRPYDSICWA